MKLPKKIKIGYKTYSIKPWSASDVACSEAYGCCDNDSQIIYIYDDLDDLSKFDTLLHEILHAIWNFADLPNDQEEEIVNRLATWLTLVASENPAWASLWSK